MAFGIKVPDFQEVRTQDYKINNILDLNYAPFFKTKQAQTAQIFMSWPSGFLV